MFSLADTTHQVAPTPRGVERPLDARLRVSRGVERLLDAGGLEANAKSAGVAQARYTPKPQPRRRYTRGGVGSFPRGVERLLDAGLRAARGVERLLDAGALRLTLSPQA